MITKILGSIILGVSLSLVPVASSIASGPSTHASCMGIESAALTPPGSSDEMTRSELAHEVKGTSFNSEFAKMHAGFHEACDEGAE